MARPPRSPFQVYVFDASSLIQLEHDGRLSMVQDPGPRIVVPDRVAREIAKPRTGLAAWLSKHPGVVSRFATAQESSLYLSLMQQATPKVDDGEAAAIALCRERRLLLVTEDKAARRKAEEHNVAWVNAEEFLEEWPLPR